LAVYDYVAFDAAGGRHRGLIEGDSPQDARERLRRRRLFASKVRARGGQQGCGRLWWACLLAAFLAVAVGQSAVGANATGREQRQRARPSESTVLTVGAEGEYGTIQAAVNAAPPGGLVRIAAGTYREQVTIDKPLVLEGAGWQRTAVVIPPVGRAVGVVRLRGGTDKAEAESSSQTRWQLSPEDPPAEGEQEMPRALINIEGASGIILRDLAVVATEVAGHADVRDTGAAVGFHEAKAEVVRCAMVGGLTATVWVAGASTVEITDSLVSFGLTGVTVDDEEGSALVVSGSEVRDCSFGVVLGKNDQAFVVGNRLLSCGDGVVSKGASPAILANAFSGCGVTCYEGSSALIGYNIFEGAGSGVLSIGDNADKAQRNTFVKNSAGVRAKGGAVRIAIERNVFANCRVGVDWDPYSESAAEAAAPRPDSCTDNLFWANDQHAHRYDRTGDALAAVSHALDVTALGNEIAPPAFRDADSGDYSLRADGAAARLGAGAPAHIGLQSVWPRLPVELTLLALQKQEEATRAHTP
jgi:hypothetical protein